MTWSYELWRHERAFDDAVIEAAGMAAEATGLPLFYGLPEGTPKAAGAPS